jgi:hypothetical protein
MGVVESVGFETRYDCPDYLIVRRGHFRSERAKVPVAHVAEIEPNRQSMQISCAFGEERPSAARELLRWRPSVARELWRHIRQSPHQVSS